MSDEILLYLILLLMLVLAVGALVPSLLRVGREEASVEREDKAYGSAVTEALRLFDGNRTKAADYLGISRRYLQYKIREYGLPARYTREP